MCTRLAEAFMARKRWFSEIMATTHGGEWNVRLALEKDGKFRNRFLEHEFAPRGEVWQLGVTLVPRGKLLNP
jgi:hypothetical protein